MSRVFITGSAEGLGLMAARLLAGDGHSVTLHARSTARAGDARAALPAAAAVAVGDLSTIAGMRRPAAWPTERPGRPGWRPERRPHGRAARPVAG
jgi:NAD(P)-dependent dehydrogenase (short-subunit alcohol dehydrogenase family)